MHSAWAQPDPASQTAAGSQENACVLYSWICLNINSYRRDKYRLHPGSTGRHQASSPCAHTHTPISTHQHPLPPIGVLSQHHFSSLLVLLLGQQRSICTYTISHRCEELPNHCKTVLSSQKKNRVQWLQKVGWPLLFFP